MKKSKLSIKKQSPDFLSLLLRSYVGYSLLIVILLTAIFLGTTYLLNDANITWTGFDISSYDKLLKNKQYDELPIKTIAGQGFVQIYDYKSDLLFSSTDDDIKFSLGELDTIPDFKRKDVIEITEFVTKDNNKQIFIQLSPANEEYSNSGQYLVLSESYKILETNIPTNKKSLTTREYKILTNNATSDKTLLKYTFVANDNSTYTAVVFDTTLRHNKAPVYIITISIVAICLIYIILLLIIVKYLMKLVRDPLYNLETGMYRFSIGNYNEKIKYEGTKEFESMTKSFNDMVEIVDAKQKENEKLQSEKNRLLAGLSHDLKTPITVIQGFAKALNDGIVKDPDEQRKYLDIIQDKSQYMASLINKMYDYSKLDHPDFSLKFEDVDIFEFTRQYFAAIYNDFELNGFNLDIDIPEEQQILKIDKEEFSRVYNNIVSNYFRYSKPNSTFKVKITKSSDSLFIYLCDSGIAIPSEYRETIFDAFTVADPARNNKGTGLGLAIIHRIITLHNATIELTEFEGFPNVFKIKFKLDTK